MTLTSTVTAVVSWLTLSVHIFLFLFLISLVHRRSRHMVLSFLFKHALVLSFVIALFGVLLSLYYSEIAGYLPCRLCWFQRIFLYPQALLLALALWRKDRAIFAYTLPLTVIGALIGLYHVFLTLFPVQETCSATEVSCATNYFFAFGYITIPVMSLTSFVLLLVFALAARQKV